MEGDTAALLEDGPERLKPCFVSKPVTSKEGCSVKDKGRRRTYTIFLPASGTSEDSWPLCVCISSAHSTVSKEHSLMPGLVLSPGEHGKMQTLPAANNL